MQVRFSCPACQQLLGVNRRKIGSRVTCPRCQSQVLVPDPDAASQAAPSASEIFEAALPVQQTARKAGAAEQQLPGRPLPDIIVYDDIAAVLGSAPVVAAAASKPDGEPEIDRRFVAVSRRVLYLQAGLIVVVSLFAFAAGYFSGRGARSPEVPLAALKPVAIQGRVSYQAEGNPLLGDSQAVVVVFPKGSRLVDKIPVDRLRPDDPPPAENDNTLRAIEASNGIYLRADEQGQFEFRVRPGVYQVLVISKHLRRPPGTEPKSKDLIALGGYFQSAPDLLGSYRYDYSERRLPEEAPLNYTFGPPAR
jgi:hypothetical protein